VAETAAEVPFARRRVRGADLVVVDTPALDRDDPASIRRVAELLAAVRADEVHLVVPAGLRADEARALVAALDGAVAVARLLVTRADEHRSLGGLATVAVEQRKPFSYLVRSSSLAPAVSPADPTEIAGMVVA
jgi:flagellar biosynthesis GTPase FlhF